MRRKGPRENRFCLGCNKVFVVLVGSTQRFCSKCCWYKYSIGRKKKNHNRKEMKICGYKECDRVFESYRSSNRKYCCLTCYHMDMRGDKNPAKRLEVKEKLSKSKKGRNRKFGLENPFYGKKHSQSFIGRRREETRGKKNPFYGRKHTEELKEGNRRIQRCLWQDPIYKEKRLKAIFGSLRLKPNKPEKFLTKLLQKLFPNEWKYVGNGKFWVDGTNPDFININGQKKIIELFGDYWHSEKRTGISEKQHMQERIRHFTEYGYQVLIIWEHELKDVEALKEKIVRFFDKR